MLLLWSQLRVPILLAPPGLSVLSQPPVPRVLTLTKLPLADISPGGSSKNEFWVFHYFLKEKECHCREACGSVGSRVGQAQGISPVSVLLSWM